MQDNAFLEFGKTIQRLRIRRGLTVRQVAESTHIAPSTVSRMEHGRIGAPKPTHLHRLAQALGVDIEELYAAAGYPLVGMPELAPYLRAKYGLTPEAAHRVEGYVESLREGEANEGTGDHN